MRSSDVVITRVFYWRRWVDHIHFFHKLPQNDVIFIEVLSHNSPIWLSDEWQLFVLSLLMVSCWQILLKSTWHLVTGLISWLFYKVNRHLSVITIVIVLWKNKFICFVLCDTCCYLLSCFFDYRVLGVPSTVGLHLTIAASITWCTV